VTRILYVEPKEPRASGPDNRNQVGRSLLSTGVARIPFQCSAMIINAPPSLFIVVEDGLECPAALKPSPSVWRGDRVCRRLQEDRRQLVACRDDRTVRYLTVLTVASLNFCVVSWKSVRNDQFARPAMSRTTAVAGPSARPAMCLRDSLRSGAKNCDARIRRI
jgi:hypothetical protein